MKKTLLAALLLVGLGSVDASSTPTEYDLTADLGDSNPRLVTMNGDSKTPAFIGLQEGVFSIAEGALILDSIDKTKVVGLQAALDAKANTSHTHSASDISGIGTYVDNRIASSTLIAQRVRVQTSATGSYTWTFPTAYSASTTPIIEVTPEDSTSAASTDVRITSVSNTSVTIQASRLTTVLGLLSLNSTPQIYVHITAFAQ